MIFSNYLAIASVSLMTRIKLLRLALTSHILVALMGHNKDTDKKKYYAYFLPNNACTGRFYPLPKFHKGALRLNDRPANISVTGS